MLVLVAASLASLVGTAAAATTFHYLSPGTRAGSMTSGPGGFLWFTGTRLREPSGPREGVVGRMDIEGQVQLFGLPEKRSAGKIVAGPDGNLWFTEMYAYSEARIGRISPGGEFVEYLLGSGPSLVRSLASGRDGALWFTWKIWRRGKSRPAIGRIDLAGEVTRYPLPLRSGPGDIVAGPDGNVWFTLRGPGRPAIGRIDPDGRITRFPLPSRRWLPRALAVGADGNLWFSEQTADYVRDARIGRISTAGAIDLFPVPGTGTGWLAPGPGGDVWFTSTFGNARGTIGKISPSGKVTEPACLDEACDLVPYALTTGPDGAPWFAAHKYYSHMGGGGTGIMESMQQEQEAGIIGRLDP
jgi:virginiamycin B lyase